MKKVLITLAVAASALTAVSPASAQYQGERYGQNYGQSYGQSYRQDYRDDNRAYRGGDIRQRLDRIDFQIDRGIQRGALTRGEAQRLRFELNNVARLAQQYSYNGLNYRERDQLEQRIGWLQQRVQFERRDNDRRYWR